MGASEFATLDVGVVSEWLVGPCGVGVGREWLVGLSWGWSASEGEGMVPSEGMASVLLGADGVVVGLILRGNFKTFVDGFAEVGGEVFVPSCERAVGENLHDLMANHCKSL